MPGWVWYVVVEFLVAYILLAWHETGHLWAAQRVGQPVEAVWIGCQPWLWEFRTDPPLRLGALPLVGMIRPRYPSWVGISDGLVIALAGPLASFATGLALVPAWLMSMHLEGFTLGAATRGIDVSYFSFCATNILGLLVVNSLIYGLAQLIPIWPLDGILVLGLLLHLVLRPVFGWRAHRIVVVCQLGLSLSLYVGLGVVVLVLVGHLF